MPVSWLNGWYLTMELRNLVILLSTFQVLFEISGILVTVFCPPCRGVVNPEDLTSDSATQFADTSWGNKSQIYKDYSRITSSHFSVYVLPHIFSGVVPRMVDRFKCITRPDGAGAQGGLGSIGGLNEGWPQRAHHLGTFRSIPETSFKNDKTRRNVGWSSCTAKVVLTLSFACIFLIIEDPLHW